MITFENSEVILAFSIIDGKFPDMQRVTPKPSEEEAVKEIGIKNPLALIEPGMFIKGFKDYVILVYNINGNKLKNIRIYQPQPGRHPGSLR